MVVSSVFEDAFSSDIEILEEAYIAWKLSIERAQTMRNMQTLIPSFSFEKIT